jgi:hypothetical protein
MLKDQALLEPQEHKPVMRYLVNLVRRWHCCSYHVQNVVF